MRSFGIILGILICFQVFAQKEVKRNYWGLNYHSGFIHAHHQGIEYLLEDRISGFDIVYGKSSYGKKAWEHLYRLPDYGFGFHYGSLGNDRVFGHIHALYSYIDIPFYRHNRFSVNYKTCFGLAYFDKPYDLETNPFNMAIGSKFNVYIRFAADVKIRLSKSLAFSSELGYIHSSNGKMKTPNQGLNQVSWANGIYYYFGEPKATEPVERPVFIPGYEMSFFTAYASKNIDHYNPGRFHVLSMSFNASKRLSIKRKMGLGLDLFYDSSLKEQYELEDTEYDAFKDVVRLGLHLSHDLSFGKASFGVQFGGYIYNKATAFNQPFYQRISLKYDLNSYLMAMVALKTHFSKADFIEWGVGLKLEKL